MIRVLQSQLMEARKLPPEQSQSLLFALQRIIIQHYCISISEWIVANTGKNPVRLTPSIDFELLRKPSDGTLASLACDLSVAAENLGWGGLTKAIWTAIDSERPCLRLIEGERETLEGLLGALVRRRNESSCGHGIPGGYDLPAEVDAIELLVERLKIGLPTLTPASGALSIKSGNGEQIELKLLKTVDGKIICYRGISSKSGGRCRVSAQVQLSAFERTDVDYECEDVLSMAPPRSESLFDVLSTHDSHWAPIGAIPDRQAEVFAGRERELEDVADWFDDSGSRACLVYGDGGIGKTTFAIECIHRLLAGKLGVSWRPELISYYTAKRTRWGVKGLEVINPAVVGATDALLNIKRAMEGQQLDRSWYSLNADQMATKIGSLLKQYGVDRESHLMIIDNCETLAQSEEEIRALSRSLREISRHVGRILVTSRRREEIESRFVEINPLSDEEAEQLLRARAKELSILHIEQAGGAKLRQFARKLGCKPLVLEVFTQILCDQNMSLERAFDRVLQMQHQDLGEFLYTDAWQRLSIELKHLLLLMTSVADVHDEVLLKLCAGEAKVSVLEAYRAIAESRGIASVVRNSGSTEVSFLPEFIRFCKNRTVRIAAHDVPDDSIADVIRQRYQHFLGSSNKQVNDRNSRAFRHPLARAAYRSASEGNHVDAELFYEMATLSDSSNAALLDRYAYYLSGLGRLDVALDRACEATAMEPKEDEFWFTRGMIESKLNKPLDALNSLQNAERLGKPTHLCALQSCYAYVKLVPPDFANARAALQVAARVPFGDLYKRRHLTEVEQVRKKIEYMQIGGGARQRGDLFNWRPKGRFHVD